MSTAPPGPEEQELTGGGVNQVRRVGDTVRRPVRPWSGNVRRLLDHLRASGFDGAPRVLGTDAEGREIVEFIEGEVGHYPWTPQVAGRPALLSAARLLRDYHLAAAGVASELRTGWQFPTRDPVEVICHNDFAPYNCVFRDGAAVGIIDFDTAGPGPRAWDLAYALYRFSPLSRPDAGGHYAAVDHFATAEAQAARARAFLDAYGCEADLRRAAVDLVVPRVRALATFLEQAAAAGEEAFVQHVRAGHLDHYLHDIEYVEERLPTWLALVVAD